MDEQTTIVFGIICNVCGEELPPMTLAEHLDVKCPLNYQCRCYEEDGETDGEEDSDDEN